MNKDGGPAFPVLETDENRQPYHTHYGMSLRDYTALKVLQGFCANPAVFASNGMSGWALVNCTENELVNYSISIADKYLKAREQ
jgi:hypothetical protein